MNITPIKTRLFNPGENLADFIIEHISSISNQSVIAIASKVVALSENRVTTIDYKQEKLDLARQECEFAVETPYDMLMTLRKGKIMPNAGIDESNAQPGKCILLPEDSYKSAVSLRQHLIEHYSINDLGVIITDSRTVLLQPGSIGVAMGYAGFKPLKSYVGRKDLYGRDFEYQVSNLPEALAAAAVFTMGEGTEQQPLAIISQMELEFTNESPDPRELIVDPQKDMYGFLFNKIR